MKSRMTRECHERFREGFGVNFPGGFSIGSKGRGRGWCMRPRSGSSAKAEFKASEQAI
jgi:hypothetical protein